MLLSSVSEVELNFIARAVIKAAQIFLFRAIFSLKLDKMKLRLNRVEIAFATKNPFFDERRNYYGERRYFSYEK